MDALCDALFGDSNTHTALDLELILILVALHKKCTMSIKGFLT